MATLNTPSIVGSLFILPLPSRGLVMWIFLENHLSMIFPSLLWKRVMILKTLMILVAFKSTHAVYLLFFLPVS